MNHETQLFSTATIQFMNLYFTDRELSSIITYQFKYVSRPLLSNFKYLYEGSFILQCGISSTCGRSSCQLNNSINCFLFKWQQHKKTGWAHQARNASWRCSISHDPNLGRLQELPRPQLLLDKQDKVEVSIAKILPWVA